MEPETRLEQLCQLLTDANKQSDTDLVAQILGDIAREFPNEPLPE